MQSELALPPAPKLIATPTNLKFFGGDEVEKDSRGPVLISRCPSSLPDIVEKDMKRSTPTSSTPSGSSPSSSSIPSAPCVSGTKGPDSQNLNIHNNLKSRGAQVLPHSGGGGGGGNEGYHSSSSSSLASMPSPTESESTDLTPQGGGIDQQFNDVGVGGSLYHAPLRCHSGPTGVGVASTTYQYGETWQRNHNQSLAALDHGPHHSGQGQPSGLHLSKQGQPPGQGYGPHSSGQGQPSGQSYNRPHPSGDDHTVQPSGSGHGGPHPSGQDPIEQPSGQGYESHPSVQPSGQGHEIQLSRQESYETLNSNYNVSRQTNQGYDRPHHGAVRTGFHDYGPGSGYTPAAGTGPVLLHGNASKDRDNVTTEYTPQPPPDVPGHFFPSSLATTSLPGGHYHHLPTSHHHTPSHPPSSHQPSQPHPLHPQAILPPSHHLFHAQYHQHYHQHHQHQQQPPSYPPYNTGHAGLAPQQHYTQSEASRPPHTHGAGLSGGWNQHYNIPHSLSSDSYASQGVSDYSPTDAQYHYLGFTEGSLEQLLPSYPSLSSYHSSLGTLSEIGGRAGQHQYGYQTSMRQGSLPHGEAYPQGAEESERCHSFPLTQQLHYYSRQQAPPNPPPPSCQRQYPDEDYRGPPTNLYPQHQHGGSHNAISSAPRSLFPYSLHSLSEEALVREVEKSLSVSDDSPAGQDETKGGRNMKHALLTMLDSDRIKIVEQPEDVKVEVHHKAILTCRARALDSVAGGDVPKLQWYRGEEPLVGEVGADLVVASVERGDVGLYYCVITHPDDDSIKKCSDVAQLSIKSAAAEPANVAVEEEEPKAPVIIEQPLEKIIAVVGEDLKLPLKVKGEPPLSFKWYKDTGELDYAKKASLVIPRAVYTDSGQYCCSVSNIHGSQLSKSFHVQVTKVKSDSVSAGKGQGQRQRPTSLHSWEGNNISDAFLREVGCAIAQQISNWQKLVTYLGLANSDLLEVRGQSRHPNEHALRLLVRWRDKYHESKSLLRTRLVRAGVDFESLVNSVPGGQVQGVEHMLIAKPRLTVHPQSQQVIYGQEFSLSIQVDSPTHQCTFQWYKNHLCLHSKTSPRLLIKSAVDSDAGEYYCMATNKGGSSDSEITFVKVVNPHATIRPSLTDKMAPHSSTVLSNWSGESVRRLHHVQSMGSMGTAAGFGGAGRMPAAGLEHLSAADDVMIGRSYLEDGRPRSWGDVEGFIGRGVGGAGGGMGSGLFSLRRGSGASGAMSMEPVLAGGEKPKIVEHPLSQAVEAGDPLTLTCAATGQGELTYLWFFNGLSLQRENRPEYFINCFTDEDEGVYYCTVSDYCGEVSSDMAHVQMKDD